MLIFINICCIGLFLESVMERFFGNKVSMVMDRGWGTKGMVLGLGNEAPDLPGTLAVQWAVVRPGGSLQGVNDSVT